MNEVARAKSAKGADADKQGLIARIVTFFKQVFSELKKVQRPTQAYVSHCTCVPARGDGICAGARYCIQQIDILDFWISAH